MTSPSVDDYVAQFPVSAQKALEEVRAVVGAVVPEATEKISYAVPTFYLDGNLVHYAAYERHIGFYPGASAIEAFASELEAYKSGRGSVQFPLGQSLPVDLIRRMVEFRVRENRRTG